MVTGVDGFKKGLGQILGGGVFSVAISHGGWLKPLSGSEHEMPRPVCS